MVPVPGMPSANSCPTPRSALLPSETEMRTSPASAPFADAVKAPALNVSETSSSAKPPAEPPALEPVPRTPEALRNTAPVSAAAPPV